MPRTKVTPIVQITEGSSALAVDMSNHVVDEGTALAVAMIANVFEKQELDKQKPMILAGATAKQGTQTQKPKAVATSEISMSKDIALKKEVVPAPEVTSPKVETVVHIKLTDLYPPEFCPFIVIDNDNMNQLAISIREFGVREPGLARPRKDDKGKTIDGYELLIGGRRKRACELEGLETLPVIIRELDDDSAIIAMVDSNLGQRDRLLPSEKAWAYRIKMEAMNHKGIKGDGHSAEIIAEQSNDSRNQIFRYIRLTELIVPLLDKVDMSKLAFSPAVELSYLSHKEQADVASAMEFNAMKP